MGGVVGRGSAYLQCNQSSAIRVTLLIIVDIVASANSAKMIV